MSKKSGSQTPTKARKAAAVRKSTASVRRRTRMIALEPRMLFDGALGVDLATQASAVDAKISTEITPAATEAPQAVTAEAAVAKSAEKPSETPAEKLAAELVAPAAGPKEVVFVDSRVKDYQGALQGVDPKAAV